MPWRRAWSLAAPGRPQGTAIGWDARRRSVLIADGWGVAFASLQVRRVDAASGEVLATVRTRTAIRAFGPVEENHEALYFLGDAKVFVHDAVTLTRRETFARRVPRYANGVAGVGPGRVALAAPRSLVELELATGRARRVANVPTLAVGTNATRTVAVLSDGSVRVRSKAWTPAGTFCAPQVCACIAVDGRHVAALAGVRPDPYESRVQSVNADGRPQSYVTYTTPTSRELHLAEVGTDGHLVGSPRVHSLPFAAWGVGILGRRVMAVAPGTDKPTVPTKTFTRSGLRVASIDCDAPLTTPWHAETVPGAFVGFAGDCGIVTAEPISDRAIALSLHVPFEGPG